MKYSHTTEDRWFYNRKLLIHHFSISVSRFNSSYFCKSAILKRSIRAKGRKSNENKANTKTLHQNTFTVFTLIKLIIKNSVVVL